ncbi:MAG: hypothetical protein QM713_07690 [Arachnia sp.]
MTRDLTTYRLRRAPVTSVSLRIGFSAAPGLRNWMLAPFLSEMRNEGAAVEELPPLVGSPDPFSLLDAPNDEFEDVPSWPVPRTRFTSADRSIAVQGDELEVTWVFDAENAVSYPGFDELSREMSRLYHRLVASVDTHDVTITPTIVECFYTNSVGGVTAATLAVGVLTGWSSDTATPDPAHGYVGVRLHTCADPETHDCASLVMVDSQDGGEAPVLAFRVGRRVGPDADAVAALAEAHDELIALFKRHTSDDLRREWGEE